MIVFDLSCALGGHRFEAWFASSDSFADQQARGLIHCPICGDDQIRKAVMAPRIGAKSNQRTDAMRPTSVPAVQTDTSHIPAANTPAMAADGPAVSAEMVRHMIAEIASKQAEMLPQSRWVGNDFADAARAMHEGRAPDQMIHGQSSPDQIQELHDDGIAAMPLLVPIVPPEVAN
ncbi:DUF1178 family protein [Sphingopyxis yananensis]|uniref:DUF1178 family protein n=1 Tax=Sphingopyxis yananensis TaxID=2886687 RepID=UPI001D101989|nr:DUF1178 family protein [Sphingopyxis yananensis]MCC2602564.1 DUF1178 family protein [Sphingopyxis yananensis]